MEGKKSKDETLLDWFDKPKNANQRLQNNKNWELAEAVLGERKRDRFTKANGLDYYRLCKEPFLNLIDTVIEDRKHKSNAYLEQAVYAKRAFVKFLENRRRGNLICQEVDSELAKDFKTFLMYELKSTRGKKLKDNTISKYWIAFKDAIKVAISQRRIQFDPLINVKGIPVKDVKHKQALTLEEVRKLFNTPSDDIFKEDKKVDYIPTKEFFMLCVTIGIGIAEAENLKWSDFKITNENGVEKWSFDYTRVKTLKEFKLRPIPHQTIKQLKFLKFKYNSDYVFPNFKLSQNNREYEKLRKWVKRAGIEKHITPHCVRSTFLSLLANHAGLASLSKIAEFIGHTDEKVTEGYITTEQETYRRIVEEIPDVYESSQLKVV